MTDTDEFVRAFQEDVRFIQEARLALETHPKARVDGSIEVSASRLLACAIVGAVESVLSRWRDRPAGRAYFDIKSTNQDRIKALGRVVHECGIEPNISLLEDFVAIKELRNAILHGGWNDAKIKFIESRGFPASLDQLRGNEWRRFITVAQELLRCLVGAHTSDFIEYMKNRSRSTRASDVNKLFDASDLRLAFHDDTEITRMLIRKHDLFRLFWHNLEVVEEVLGRRESHQTNDVAVHGELVNVTIESWAEVLGILRAQRNTTMHDFGMALTVLEQLHRANNYAISPLGVQLDELTDMILSEATDLTLTGNEDRETQLLRLGQRMSQVRSEGIDLKKQMWEEGVPEDICVEFVALALRCAPAEPRAVATALQVGYLVYRRIRNNSPVEALTRVLHGAPPANQQLAEAARSALLVWKLRDAWYSYVESVRDYVRKPRYETWRKYDSLLENYGNKV